VKITTAEIADFVPAFGIGMAPISGLPSGHALGGSFGRVEIGGETSAHHHDETEAFLILRGSGEVFGDSVRHFVGPGAVVVFEPFESHVLRNIGDQEILFVDLYWRDPARTARAAKTNGRERLAGRPVFVFSTPPTPNGDLHLGHLSGPYLGADVFVRFQRMNGIEAYHLTGSDDFQSFVVGRARQECSTPTEIAARYAAEIHSTLELMDIRPDQYTVTSTAPGYSEGLRAFFSSVIRSGLEPQRGDALFDHETDAYLYEVDVAGECPTCGASTGGNICEECGEPNTCVELVKPRSKLSTSPPRDGVIERYSLPIHAFRDVVLDHHRHGKTSPRLQNLAARIFGRGDFHLPVTHPSRWGVRPAEYTEGEQVIWVWLEMAYGFLHGIAELGGRLGRKWAADQPRADWKIIHFFGYDNSFYHTILFPILYKLAYPDWRPDIDYNVNEFYLLDGKKFSTSRRHAIWGKEILAPETVDSVRYYLSLTRGEAHRADFTVEAFRQTVTNVLIGRWQAWLAGVGARVATSFEGIAPDAGSWTPMQSAFLACLQVRLDAITGHYGANGFSLNAVMRELNGLVDDAIRFTESHRSLPPSGNLRDEFRTTVALELAAAQLLALCTAPVMPRFAERLANALGGTKLDAWRDHVELVPPGTEIAIANTRFFSLPSAAATSECFEKEIA
jgi:methionyl-tRNA synthetase